MKSIIVSLFILIAGGAFAPAEEQVIIYHFHYDAKRYVGEWRVDPVLTRDIDGSDRKKGVFVALTKFSKGDNGKPLTIAFPEESPDATAADLKKAVKVTLQPTVFLDRLWVSYYDAAGEIFFTSTMYPLDETIPKK